MFRLDKMISKGLKAAAATGVIAGGGMVASMPEVGTDDKALVTAVITVVSFLFTSFMNWRKHK